MLKRGSKEREKNSVIPCAETINIHTIVYGLYIINFTESINSVVIPVCVCVCMFENMKYFGIMLEKKSVWKEWTSIKYIGKRLSRKKNTNTISLDVKRSKPKKKKSSDFYYFSHINRRKCAYHFASYTIYDFNPDRYFIWSCLRGERFMKTIPFYLKQWIFCVASNRTSPYIMLVVFCGLGGNCFIDEWN